MNLLYFVVSPVVVVFLGGIYHNLSLEVFSLPEFNFKLFGKTTILGVKQKFGVFFWAIHSASEPVAKRSHAIYRNLVVFSRLRTPLFEWVVAPKRVYP